MMIFVHQNLSVWVKTIALEDDTLNIMSPIISCWRSILGSANILSEDWR